MPIPTREELKAFLETGDTPTEAQFGEIIDAMFDLAQSSQDTADEALALMTASAAKSARCFGLVNLANVSFSNNHGTYTNLKLKDCAVTAVVAFSQAFGAAWRYNVTVTIVPDVDFLDDDFTVLAFVEGDRNTNLSVLGIIVATRAVDEVVLTFQIYVVGVGSSRNLQFAIFD